MALKPSLLFSVAFFLLLTYKITLAEVTSPATAPTPPPPAAPTTPAAPPSSKLCVGPCWNRCHDIKAKNIKPCMVVCTRCCMKCGYVIPPTCKNWTTFTIEGYTYPCP